MKCNQRECYVIHNCIKVGEFYAGKMEVLMWRALGG